MSTTRGQHIANVVKAARLVRGWTQADLAREVGVHTQTIGNLERATVETSPELLDELERVLHVDLSNLGMVTNAQADIIRRELIRRFAELDEAESLLLAGETLRFIIAWGTEAEMSDRARRVAERAAMLQRRQERSGDVGAAANGE